PVHLHQDLVQSLLALVVRAAETGAALAPDRIDLIDKDDTWRIALGLVEEVAHTRGADTDEHFNELGTTDGEEGHTRFAGHGTRKERLTCARRSHQKHTAWHTGAQGNEL